MGKTTSTFNLGWKLAELGKKVVMVDADPQCNLTGMVLSFQNIDDIANFYQTKGNSDLYTDVKDFIMGAGAAPSTFKTTPTSNPGLSLIAGNINLGIIEAQIQVALRVWQALPALAKNPGFYPKMIRESAEKVGADYVLIDTAPSVGALNQCLLMGSDYFIVPTAPDYYSVQAIQSMASFLPRWNEEIQPFRNGHADESVGQYRLQKNPPKFIGYIIQNYRVKNSRPTSAFRKWITSVEQSITSTLVDSLMKEGLCSQSNEYKIASFSDYNSLIAKAQEKAKPVFSLSKNDLVDWTGIILERAMESMKVFSAGYEKLATEVINRAK